MRPTNLSLVGLLCVTVVACSGFMTPVERRARRGSVGKRGSSVPEEEPLAEASFWQPEKVKVLGALALAYTSNQWCRSLLFSTVNFDGGGDGFRFINVALGMDQSQYALLSTLAFNALFSGASLVAGAAADRVDAGLLTAGSCAAWSAATVALGASNSVEQVAVCRALQGLAMSATAPAGYSLLSRTFAPAERARANSAYASAVSVGGALASASILLDEKYGWRQTFNGAGLAGLGIAALALTQLLPKGSTPKQAVVAEAKSASSWDFLWSGDPVVVAIYVTTALRFCAGFGIGVWALPTLRAHFPERAADFGLAYALVVGVCGAVSAILGGFAADAAASRTTKKDAARALVPALGCLLAAPLWILAVQSASFETAIGLLALEFLVAESWIGPTTALLASVVPTESRGRAQGLFTALSLVGNAAPLAIGALAASYNIDTLVAFVVAAAYVASSLGFLTIAALLSAKDDEEAGPPASSAQ